MNTDEDFRQAIGKRLVGCGAVPEKNLVMLFFDGVALAFRVEGGILIWELHQDTEH